MKKSLLAAICILSSLATSCSYSEYDGSCDASCNLRENFCAYGVCSPKLHYGEDCDADDMCISGICLRNQCTCSEDAPCPDGKFCEKKEDVGFCVALLENGKSCSDAQMCLSGYCDEKGACANKLTGGTACKADTECLTGSCLNGTCTCSDSAPCADTNHFCDVKTCKDKLAAGKSCSDDTMCLSGNCIDQKCSEFSLGGAQCTSDTMCLSGKCTNRFCECSEQVKCIDSMYCRPDDNACVQKLEIGANCYGNNTLCQSGFCSNEDRCVDTYPGGKSCLADYMCKSGNCIKQLENAEAAGECGCNETVSCLNSKHFCDPDTGACADKREADQPCTRNDMCINGACDMNTQKCLGRKGGESCVSGNECASGSCVALSCTCRNDGDCAESAYCDGKKCQPKHLGADTCSTHNECMSGKCDTDLGRCTCSVVNGVACLNDMTCALDNSCYATKDNAKTCSNNYECKSNLCVDNKCTTCQTDAECGQGFACDAGICQKIVNCPGSSTKQCIAIARLVPNKDRKAGALAPTQFTDPRDFLSENISLSIPDNVNFCISSIYDEAFMAILNKLIEINASNLSVEEKNALIGAQLPMLLGTITFDNLDKYFQRIPFVWAVFYDSNACQIGKDGVAPSVCIGANSEAECKCVASNNTVHPSAILPYSKSYLSQLTGMSESGEQSQQDKMTALMKILMVFMDKRIFSRLENGCVELTLGQNIQYVITEKEKDAFRGKLYFEMQLKNSNMMTTGEGFDLGGASDNTNLPDPNKLTKKDMTTPYSTQAVQFPIKTAEGTLVIESAKPDKNSKDSFHFNIKPTYHGTTTSTGVKYTDILCDDYYTMSFDRKEAQKQYCTSEEMCSYDALQEKDGKIALPEGNENCVISVFSRFEGVKVYMELN